MGIEPTSLAWKAKVLPLNYTRGLRFFDQQKSLPGESTIQTKMVEGAGFEPAYSERTDLQSVAFNHSATPPTPEPTNCLSQHCSNTKY